MKDVEIIRSRRKTLALEITRDCRVLVRAPLRASQAEIAAFVSSHREWIARNLELQRQKLESAPPPATPEEIAALKARAREALPPLVDHWSHMMGVTPTGFRVTSARHRYGSCSAENRLCFSCFLMRFPPEAIELVVVHELCHILEKNHGPRFYALLEQHLPDHAQRKKLLK